MDISKFISDVNLNDRVREYHVSIKPSEIILFKDFHPEIKKLFDKNRISILNSFFRKITENLKENEFEYLKQNLNIFYLEPFESDNINKIENILNLRNAILKNCPHKVTAQLLNFYYTFLDHILSTNIYDQFEVEIRSLKTNLNFLSQHSEEKALLAQKIEQYL